MKVLVLLIIVLVLAYIFVLGRENATSQRWGTTAGGPDNITRAGVVASGHDRELVLPGDVDFAVADVRAYPLN